MIDNKTNVLVLGIGQSNFLNALYGEILKRDNSFNFHIDVIKHLPKDSFNETKSVFGESLNFSNRINELSGLKRNWIFCKAMTKRFFIETLLFELSQKKSIKEALQFCKKLALKEYVYQNYIQPKKFDVLHFHFCTRSNLEYLYFIKNDNKVICSFWGSDLWRMSTIRDNYYVSKALERADVITVQTAEMALALKAKYGIQLSDKVRDLRFTISTAIYEAINLYRNNATVLAEFKHKYAFTAGKYLVALGHNGFQENNHLEMIEVLKQLPAEYKNQIIFILHLGYGMKEKYLDDLKKVVQEASDLELRIIRDFMNPEQTAKLRLVTDVMIHAPISDALSGTMTEVLYAGNKVIAGGWLPFGILRRNNIYFDDFEKFEHLPSKLIQTIEQVKNGSSNSVINKQYIEDLLFPDRTSKEWIELLKNIKNE